MTFEEFSSKLSDLYTTDELIFLYKYIKKEGFSDKLESIIPKLGNMEPIDYILGYTYFYHSKFNVNNNVLIPRPETEELVDLIVKENRDRQGLKVLDIGTGSGCIAISLARFLPNSEVTALDISSAALDVAKNNSKSLNINVEFMEIDILNDAKKIANNKWDIIVSNPPYIPIEEKKLLEKNIDFEPDIALYVPDNEVFIFYDEILKYSELTLKSGGKLYFEVHQDFQTNFVVNLEKTILKDISGNVRFLKYGKL